MSLTFQCMSPICQHSKSNITHRLRYLSSCQPLLIYFILHTYLIFRLRGRCWEGWLGWQDVPHLHRYVCTSLFFFYSFFFLCYIDLSQLSFFLMTSHHSTLFISSILIFYLFLFFSYFFFYFIYSFFSLILFIFYFLFS